MNHANGVVSGAPTITGQFQTELLTTSNTGYTSVWPITFDIALPPPPVISTASLPAGKAGTAYHQTLAASNVPTLWAITSGSLPTGLTLDTGTGVISGIPAAAGTINFTVTATNAGGTSAGKALSITLVSPLHNTGNMPSARGHHTATLLPSGKVLVTGGKNGGTALSGCDLYDPVTGVWTPVAAMGTARFLHAAVLLPSGRVLVMGGCVTTNHVIASCEIYDPLTNQWSATAPLATARCYQTTTLLPNGMILVTGGSDFAHSLTSCEVFNPFTETWSSTAPMGTLRAIHTATLLPNGRVLVAGGYDGGAFPASCELYNPATGTWSATTPLAHGREAHISILLPSGKVLVSGGTSATSELYDPVNGTWSMTGTPLAYREGLTSNLLPSGKVLVTGGNDPALATNEIYDPDTGAWYATAPMAVGRVEHSATLLPSGEVLLAGGVDTYVGGAKASSEIYDPNVGSWASTGVMATGRCNHSLVALPSGKVLAIGGSDMSQSLATCERFDRASNTWTATGSMSHNRNLTGAVLLPNGKVLVTGGTGETSCELYDPAAGTWSAAAPMSIGRYAQTATLLPNGKVLVTGGTTGAYQSSCELYDPGTNTWGPTGSLGETRGYHIAILLATGKVLVMGGFGGAGYLARCELYDPGTGTWSATGTMLDTRMYFTATALSNGKILVAGGDHGSNIATCELYDPAVGTWSATGSLSAVWGNPRSVLLPSGKVLLMGGGSGVAYTACELYDPANGTWSPTASLLSAQGVLSAIVLPDGKVLASGGDLGGVGQTTCEVFDPGLGFSVGERPVISTAPASLPLGFPVALGGTLFTGISTASCDRFSSSPSNYPLVQVQSGVNGQWRWLGYDASASYTATAVTATMASDLPPGPATVRVIVNAVPSLSVPITLTIPPPPVITTTSLPSWKVGLAYHQTLAATNHPTSWTMTGGSLPAGLSLVANAGLITGTPTTIGTSSFTVTATNAGGTSAGQVMEITILSPMHGTGNLTMARAVHTTTLLPSGKVLVTGGTINNASALSTCELHDPATGTWSATGALTTARAYHTATLLPSGKVLVTGGTNFTSDVATCEVYDPMVGTWSATGGLPSARWGHTAMALASGKVLVAGGRDVSTNVSANCALYDPTLGTWTNTGTLNTARAWHTMTMLPIGKVLVSGGWGGGSGSYATCEIYDPGVGSWTVTGTMADKRYQHTATLLPTGKVLVSGGYGIATVTNTCELFDPGTNLWTVTGAMAQAKYCHSASLLPSGLVWVTGGSDGGTALTIGQLYDPLTGIWATTTPLATARFFHAAVLLPSGKVLVTGGDGGGGGMASSEVYDPNVGGWTATTGPMATVRCTQAAVRLTTGKVLVMGGNDNGNGGLVGAELYDPDTATFSVTGSMTTKRAAQTATRLLSGAVLVSGGSDGSARSGCEIYAPGAGTFSVTGAMATARYSHTATLLPSGKVLVAGGHDDVDYLSSCEIYDPGTATWSPTGSLAESRMYHTATLLPSGKVLVAGGRNAGGLSSCELFDPAAGTWSAIASMTDMRLSHTATLLPSGKVLVTGGYGASPYLASCECFNPGTGSWTVTGSLATARQSHAATLLPTGMVLVSGGAGLAGSLASCEMFDPGTGGWTTAASLTVGRLGPTATLLLSGQVLVTGGSTGADYLASGEVYTQLGGSLHSSVTVSSVTVSVRTLTLTGFGFTPIIDASGGTTNASPTNAPVIQLERQDSGQTWWLSRDQSQSVSNTTCTVTLPVGIQAGPAVIRAFVNGIASPALPFTVPPPPVIITTTYLPGGKPGTAYHQTLAASNAPTLWAITSGNLPTGLVLDTTTGMISGTPTVIGTYDFTVTATNAGGTSAGKAFSITIVSPFSNTGAMVLGRRGHTATLLPDGRTLVTGGHDGSHPLLGCELFDPRTGTWTMVATLISSRFDHTATLLRDGRVLVAGGCDATNHALAGCQIFDPATGTWTSTGDLGIARLGHTATLLPDGRVLVTAGSDAGNVFLASCEIFDPDHGTWSAASSLALGRHFHTATLLPNGKVLMTGGYNNSIFLSDCALYDVGADTWTATASMASARLYHTATLLPNGKVLVAGGLDSASGMVQATECYDPGTGLWSPSANGLTIGRGWHSASLLPNGRVLVAGGVDMSGTLATWELYDPGTDTWRFWSDGLAEPRAYHTATLQPDGRVLLCGSINGATSRTSCEMFDASTSAWSTTGAMVTARQGATATVLASGQVLATGGYGVSSALTGSELYTPGTGQWTLTTGAMATARCWHAATLLPSGKVLVTGGQGAGGNPLPNCELYDPATGTWSATGSLAHGRYYHTATLLPSGKVLVAGGLGTGGDAGNNLASSELYDPATGTWTATTGSLAVFRCMHTATLLASGHILVAGGQNISGYLASSELFNPATGTWSPTASPMGAARYWHTATLLPSGQVLVAGGCSTGVMNSSELYDPGTGTWRATNSTLVTQRYTHAAVLLPSGHVLVAGGYIGDFLTYSEVFDPITGTWTASHDTMAEARNHFPAVLLSSGQVLVVGGQGYGSGSGALAGCGLYDPRGYTPHSAVTLTAAISSGTTLTLTGSGFSPAPTASGGNSQSSPSNAPVVQLRRGDNERTWWLLRDQTRTLSDGTCVVRLPADLQSGPVTVRAFVNGIASNDVSILTPGSVLFVRTAAAGANNGTSWSNAFTDLQAALAVAVAGQQVWVAAGTYRPTTGADRSVSFIIPAGVLVHGGFAGTETDVAQADPSHNPTVLSGDINVQAVVTDNAYNVVWMNPGAMLDGFVVRDAYSLSQDSAGGIFMNGGTVQRCVVRDNSTDSCGGGIAMYGLNPRVDGCLVMNNQGYNGGGLHVHATNAQVVNTAIVNNNGPVGAGMDVAVEGVTLTHCTITGNAPDALNQRIAGTVVVVDSIIAGNRTGGAFDITHSLTSVAAAGAGNVTGSATFLNAANPLGADGRPFTLDDGFQLTGGSPGLDVGVDADVATDICATPRPQGAGIDMGAYEKATLCAITSSSGANGTIAPLGTTTVASHASQTFAITPSAGWQIATLTVDGSARTPVSSYLFRDVTTNHTINATFLHSQTITFPSVPNQIYSGSNLTIPLTATASSGLTVSYSVVCGSASVTGSTLTVSGTGNVVVAANQAGDVNYAPASVFFRTILVQPMSSSFIAFGDQGRTPASLHGVMSVAAGGQHTLALKRDGTVVAWGDNGWGQATVPAGLKGVTGIAAGGGHALALKGDGTVVAWGENDANQATVPGGLSGVLGIAAGRDHSLAINGDGTVTGWGNNTCNQITMPNGLSGVTALSAGNQLSLALKNDGSIVGWGLNDNGQATVPNGLGVALAVVAGDGYSTILKSDGTVSMWGSPLSIPNGLNSVTAMAGGRAHMVVRRSDGTVVAWGNNSYGQASVPANLSNVNAVSAGDWHTVSLKNDGTVVAWGWNPYGQSLPPSGLSGVVTMTAGRGHTLALKADGTVAAWGNNGNGEVNVPSGLSSVIAIAAGEGHSLALKNDGTVVGWGSNTLGQTTIPDGLNGVIAIVAGADYSVALKNDGTVVAWGDNRYGQISVPDGLAEVTAIAANFEHTVALKRDGTVVAWGWNVVGQAVVPTGLGNVIAIAAGAYHSLALKSNGTVVAWGSSTPPDGLHDVSSIAAGHYQAIALKNDGAVVAWGQNNAGAATVPAYLSGVTSIAAGGYQTWAFLPSRPVNAVTITNRTVPFDGVPKTVDITTVNGRTPTSTTYNGSYIPPTAAAIYTVVAEADYLDSHGISTGTLTILPPPPVISTTTLPSGTRGVAYSQTLAASDSPTLWVITSGSLPTGLVLAAATGVISGTPTVLGTSSFTVTATNTGGTSAGQALSLTILPPPPVISTTTLPSGTRGVAYSQILAASDSPTLWVITSGSLPTGLVLDAATGTISGTPTVLGTSSFTVTATNAGGTGTGQALSLTILPPPPVISTSALPSGTRMVLYNQTLTASDSPTLWVITSGSLSTGLVLAAATGVISGTPTVLGTSLFTVTATNAGGTSAGQALSLTILPPPPVISTTTLPSGTRGIAYSQILAASDNPILWVITGGSLPTGLVIDAATGVISGTPTVLGTSSFTVTATNAGGTGAGQTLSLTILPPPPIISTTTLPVGTRGVAYNQTLAASENPTLWTITSGSLPTGLDFSTATGVINGTPTMLGTSTFTVTATNAGGTSAGQALSLTILPPPPVITTTTLPHVMVGVAYDQTLEASNIPTSWAITVGSLPAGLFLDAGTGRISGTPTIVGAASFTVTATNAGGVSTGQTLEIIIDPPPPVITTTSLPSGAVGVGYLQALAAENGPTLWMITDGSLPAGLVLTEATGVISGTPTTIGTSYFTVTAGNISGTSTGQEMALTINDPPPAISTVSLPDGVVGVAYRQILLASHQPDFWMITAGGLPAGLVLDRTAGVISGIPTVAGTRHLTVVASNAGGDSVGVAFSLAVVNPPIPEIATTTLVPAVLGVPYSVFLTALNYPTAWEVMGGSLPSGLILNRATGEISGTPTALGISPFTVTAGNISGISAGQALSLTVNPPVPVIDAVTLPDGTLGVAYAQSLVAVNGPTSWVVSVGRLPAGLNLIAETGVISGTPTATGTSLFTITASNVTGISAGRDLAITIHDPVPVIATTTLPDGIWGAAYSETLAALNHADTWAISSGSLPDGLTLKAATGVIIGTPTAVGTQAFTVTASNASGTSVSQALSIAIRALTITTASGANGVITPAGVTAVISGGRQTCNIVPAAGYRIATMTVDGVDVAPTGSFTFTPVTTDHTLAATFSAISPTTFAIIATNGSNGSVTPAGTTTVVAGGRQTYSITPDMGYQIATMTIDGSQVTPAETYTFTGVGTDHTIDATFSIIPITYPITATSRQHGTMTPDGTTLVASGSSLTYAITPDERYQLAILMVDGVSVTPVASYTFQEVTASHTIEALFVKESGTDDPPDVNNPNNGPTCGLGSGAGLVMLFVFLVMMWLYRRRTVGMETHHGR